MQIQKFSSANDFTEESVKKIEDIFRKAIEKRGKAFVALSGGKTPRPIYEKLAESDLDFSKVEFFLADERYTSLESDDSNYKLILETLFKNKSTNSSKALAETFSDQNHLAFSNFHFFDTQLAIQDCLKQYEQEMKKIPNIQFDLIILGIGTDGHFASVFPGSEALSATEPALYTQTEQFAVRDRLTLSASVILQAKNILILLQGQDKASVLQELENGSKIPQEFPAKVLVSHANLLLHYLPL